MEIKSEEIENILSEYNEKIERYETQAAALETKIAFCKEHNFEEELRISRVRYEAIDMIAFKWRGMYNKLKALTAGLSA